MGQPNPPGDLPLFEGLGSEWNDIVGAFPEDKRAELAPLLKSRIDSYEPLKQWEDFQKNGITPDQAKTALNLFDVIENNPKQVYETIGRHLGITAQEAKTAVTEIKKTGGLEGADEDPRIAQLENQLNTLVQIQLAQRDQSKEQQLLAQQEQALDNELTDLKKKYGEDYVNEGEVVMRMLQFGISAEEAHKQFETLASDLRRRRPAPMLLGNGGAVPARAIDPVKLSSNDTKGLVAQMLQHARQERQA